MNTKEPMDKTPDEIDLYELYLVLKKRRNCIFLLLFIGILIGGAINLLSPSIYQARAILWVDVLQNQKIVEKKNNFVLNINLGQTKIPDVKNIAMSILNSLEFKKKLLKQFKDPHAFKVDIDKKTGSIHLICEAKDKKVAEDILNYAIEEFENNFYIAYDKYEKAKVSIWTSELEKMSFIIHTLEQPTSLDEPVKPKRTVIFAVSAISSLMLGIFFALLVEWWSNLKARKKDKSNSSE